MVGIIILNYNGSRDTCACVKDLRANLKEGTYRIIVVDNASAPEDRNGLQELDAMGIQVIYNNENSGYAAGNNIGIRAAMEQGCSHICVMNNDTVIGSDFLTPCVAYLDEHPEVAFVGPTLLNGSGEDVQSTGGTVDILRGRVAIINGGIAYKDVPETVECDYVCGACILFRVADVEALGLIPEQYFLFFEETEWCYRAKRHGYKNVVLGTTYIRHIGSVTVEKISALSSYLMARNRLVFVKRNSNTCKYLFFVCFYAAESLYRGLRYGKGYFHNLSAMWDGICNRVDLKRFPFIKIKP